MSAQQITLPPFAKLARSVGATFNRAAPESIRWAAESAFFEQQIRAVKAKIKADYHFVLVEGIERGVETTIDSCRNAARMVAAMGLSMNPAAKLVYFIPRRARERYDQEPWSEYELVPWVVDATPSYMGLCYIGTHYADARTFGASEVYTADKFVNRGPFQLPLHEPTRDNGRREEKVAEGAYASVILKTGDVRTEYVDAPTIQRIRALSKLSNSLMYTTVWTEGWKKIALRRLCKLVLQGDPRLVAAEQAMQESEGFTFNEQGEPVNDVPRGTSQVPDPAKGMAGLKEKMARKAEEQAQAPGPVENADPTQSPALLALPAPSKHPEGSIEWWCDQVLAAPDGIRLDAIKAAALGSKLDLSDDAPTFRTKFAEHRRSLKEAGKL